MLRRLHNLVQVLRHDESVEVDSNEWPGLGGISQYIITNFIQHKDKDIRLYAVLVCMEIFHIVRYNILCNIKKEVYRE